jgi:hypothetical protein
MIRADQGGRLREVVDGSTIVVVVGPPVRATEGPVPLNELHNEEARRERQDEGWEVAQGFANIGDSGSQQVCPATETFQDRCHGWSHEHTDYG